MDDIDNLIHDMRNPLNAISLNAELARMLIRRPGNEEKLAKALELILQECQRCSTVLNSYREDHE